MTVTTASRYAKASREELIERIDELQGEVEGREGDIADLNDRIYELQDALDEAQSTDKGEVLIGIRDDLRAGDHARALLRLTAWLDEHVHLWRTLGPEKAIGAGAGAGPALPLEDAA